MKKEKFKFVLEKLVFPIILLFIGGIVTYLLNSGTNSSVASSPAQQIQGDSNINALSKNGNVVAAGRDAYVSQGPIIIGDTSSQLHLKATVKGDSKSQTMIDNSVKSYNAQPGSITAREVTIAEEKGITVENNFDVDAEMYPDGRWVFKVYPKYGQWFNSFAACLASDSVIFNLAGDIKMNYFYGQRQSTAGLLDYKSFSHQTTRHNPLVVFCSKKPSILYFGDVDSSNKTYHIK